MDSGEATGSGLPSHFTFAPDGIAPVKADVLEAISRLQILRPQLQPNFCMRVSDSRNLPVAEIIQWVTPLTMESHM
jgi:hypothetical protein